VDAVHFIRPCRLGQVVIVAAMVNRTFSSSMEVGGGGRRPARRAFCVAPRRTVRQAVRQAVRQIVRQTDCSFGRQSLSHEPPGQRAPQRGQQKRTHFSGLTHLRQPKSAAKVPSNSHGQSNRRSACASRRRTCAPARAATAAAPTSHSCRCAAARARRGVARRG
jgi:hypothetical protein